MNQKIDFKYFYGNEADSYTFYRIPKLLIIDEAFKGLSSDAKLLYGLMLDRMSLSRKNGWLDADKRVYIYFSIDDAMENLNCSKNKAMKSLQELDSDTGMGLIERVKQGQGKPAIVYVKNFMPVIEVLESQNMGFKTPKICDSRISKEGTLESQIMNPNKNKIYNNKINNIESNLISYEDQMGWDVNAYMQLIKDNLEIEILYERYPFERELLEGIFELVVETVISRADVIVIASSTYPAELVRNKFLKLNSGHIEYVMDCMRKNTTKIRNMKKYMLAALFNAPTTMSGYYHAEVNHEFPQYAKAK